MVGSLQYKNIHTVIVAGMQTKYCIDATVKAGHECGFHIIVPEGANTTFDKEFLSTKELHAFFNQILWQDRFAEVMSTNILLTEHF